MITSSSNQRIRELSALISKHKERKKTGLFTAEGIKLFKETPKELLQDVYVSESFEKDQERLLDGTPYTVISDKAFASLCDTKTPQGVLSVIKMPEYKFEDLYPSPDKAFIAVLEDVQDPGNVGTIMRTSEGAGVTGIILSRGCADLFSPKTIRSTMGSVFRVPFIYTDDVCGCADRLKNEGIKCYAAHLKGTAYFDSPDYKGGKALFIGNEGNGLTDQLTDKADVLVRIPMEGKLESLNASVAAGILLYRMYRS